MSTTNFALLAGFFWYRCYYPHRSRDSLSLVCGIFFFYVFILFFLADWQSQGLLIEQRCNELIISFIHDIPMCFLKR